VLAAVAGLVWSLPQTEVSHSLAQQPHGRLLIAVETAPPHFAAREAIRATWGALNATAKSSPTQLAWQVDIKFFVAHTSTSRDEAISSENGTRGDIVMCDGFEDSYENLSRKTLAIMGYGYDHGFTHVAKADDDSFLVLETILEILERSENIRNIYAGHFQDHGQVMSNPLSKWYMRDQYPHDLFPKYAFGPCYIVGTDIITHIAAQRTTLVPYRVEDAAIALWTEGVPKTYVELDSFLNLADCSGVSRKPAFVSPANPSEMHQLLENIRHFDDVCGADRGFVLDECRVNRCRCWPELEDGSCYSDFADDTYADVIPRT